MKDTRQYRSKHANYFPVARLAGALLAVLLAASSASAQTPYIDVCEDQKVPIPPPLTVPADEADWFDLKKTNSWVFQGALQQNLLGPGDFAGVWTYSDDSERGACIALPRGSNALDGGPGNVAGIICQSATTGHACFWDNIDKNDSTNTPLGWRGISLMISKLKDGTNLIPDDDLVEGGRCTECHTGNNVFLISPDDKTWKKVLEGPLNGPSTGTFTTQLLHITATARSAGALHTDNDTDSPRPTAPLGKS